MRKLYLIAVLFILALSTGFSQSLHFCEGVNDQGQPVNSSSTFKIDRNGGYFFFLVQLPYQINCTSVKFKIYKRGPSGNLTFDTSISTDTERNWSWFWKQVTFTKPGNFEVEVVDCNGNSIVSRSVKVEYR